MRQEDGSIRLTHKFIELSLLRNMKVKVPLSSLRHKMLLRAKLAFSSGFSFS